MLLFHHLLSTLSRGRNLPTFPNELKPIIKSHTWPGNIRELRNMIEYYISIHEISSNLTEDIKSFLEVGNEVITPLSTHTGLTPGKMPEEIQFPNAEIKDHCLCILKLLREAKKQDTAFIGRSRLKLQMESSFHQTLSFEQIKSRQKLLSKFGLIVPLVGKGCYLSKAGEAYLAKYED